VLDFSHPGVRAVVYEGPDAILRRWLRPPFSVDGWRLDVIHMLGEGGRPRNNAFYVREFRRAVKEENPDAYLLGEHFSEATRWLQGDQEDGAMNYYGFTRPVQAWIAGVDVAFHPTRLDTAQFESWLARARGAIAYETQLAQLNLLDSHDTPRLLTLARNIARMKLAVTLLFAYPGVPCVYYGDEIGLEGSSDPDCRRCFNWHRSEWKLELFEHYRALIKLRKERREWREGAYQTLALSDDWLAFARYTQQQATIFIVNRGAGVEVEIPVWQLPPAESRWRLPDGAEIESSRGKLSVSAPAGGSVILLGEP
jgi:alpha-glucosidase